MEDLEDELLDDRDPYLSNNKLMDYISWWEKRRFFYNTALFTSYAIAIFVNWYNAMNMGWLELAFWLFIYTLIANVFYTVGWAIELLRAHYFRTSNQIFLRYKTWFWLIGTVFSGGWFYHLLSNYLENWSPYVYFQF